MELSLVNSKIYCTGVEFAEKSATRIGLPEKAEQENLHSFEILDLKEPEFSQGAMKLNRHGTLTESENAAELPMEKKAGSKQSIGPVSSQRSTAKSVALVALGLFTLYVTGACLKGSFNPLDWVTRLQYWRDRNGYFEACVRTGLTWPWENPANDVYCQGNNVKILSGPPISLQHYGSFCKPETPENRSTLVNWIHSQECVEQVFDFQEKFGDRLTPLSLFCFTRSSHKICAQKFPEEIRA